jgi:hypothetical protein
MLNDEMKDEELDGIIESMASRVPDISEYLDFVYESLLFLGSSPASMGEDELDMALVNIRICFRFYMLKEDYLKVSKLKELKDRLTNAGKHIVSNEFLESISINKN